MSTAIVKGNVVRVFSDTFVDENDQPIDPTLVTVIIKKPSSMTTYKTSDLPLLIVHDGTGQYHLDVPTDEVGQWIYRFEGSGAVVAANENSFFVESALG